MSRPSQHAPLADAPWSRVKNTSMYEGHIKGPTGDWLPSVFMGDSQHVTFEGLTPGTI
jgi:hypothetical protein